MNAFYIALISVTFLVPTILVYGIAWFLSSHSMPWWLMPTITMFIIGSTYGVVVTAVYCLRER